MITINQVQLHGQKVYSLTCQEMEVLVCPEDGMNIYRICYGATSVIDVDPVRYKNKALYGMPILYPTPNRIKENKFVYKGKEYLGETHGIIKRSSFKVVETQIDHQSARITGVLDFREDTKEYQAFPFISSMKITIAVFKDRMTYDYEVENNDSKELPYGFAVHPFFQNPKGDVKLETQAKKVMEMTEEKLPTGNLLDTANTEFDLSKPQYVTDLSLDHVYSQLQEPAAVMDYGDFKVTLKATEDFSHLVVFTPKDQPYFCIENQTCSTDTHNLYNKGFKEESGLMIIKPGEKQNGQINMRFS